jgi:Zn-dependent peptidase ImmA (M78 family)
MVIRRKHIRALVEKILTERNIRNAPVEVDTVARQLGLKIRKVRTDGDISGFLFRAPRKSQPVIGVNSRHHKNRQRFTIAHELGHYLLHGGDEFHVDRDFKMKLRSSESSLGVDVEEMEANFFAAELLMPKSFLEKDLSELGSIDLLNDGKLRKLASKYDVSSQALAFRLAYLRYVRL